MTELEELRLAYAECSRQKNELLTAHKQNAEQVRVLREALEAVMRYPEIRACVGGHIFRMAAEALETTK